MRGRKPKRAALKLASGETRPSRVNYAEPDMPLPASLEPPKRLKGAGLAMWREHAEPLTTAGSLKSSDIPLFAHVCEVEMVLEKLWPRVRAGDAQAMREWRQMLGVQTRQMTELGMSSVARTRVKSEGPQKATPEEERFFGVIRGGRA